MGKINYRKGTIVFPIDEKSLQILHEENYNPETGFVGIIESKQRQYYDIEDNLALAKQLWYDKYEEEYYDFTYAIKFVNPKDKKEVHTNCRVAWYDTDELTTDKNVFIQLFNSYKTNLK